MKLKRFDMEHWFIKTADAKYNFSESGVPDFKLKEFLKKTKNKMSVFDNVYLGNNDTKGSLDFRKKVSNLYKSVHPQSILITNGTSESLYIFFHLFLKKNSKILVLHPAFPMLYLVPQALGAKVYPLNILKQGNKEQLLKDICLKMDSIRPDLLIINTPHNPTGFVFTKKEIEKIVKTAKKYDVAILFDEHYRFLPVAEKCDILPSSYDIARKIYKNIYAVGSIIKCLGIVGVRIGWMITDKPILKKIRDYKDYTTHCVPLINEKIAGLAIDNFPNITKESKRRIKTNWDLLKKNDIVKKNKLLLNYELEGGCVYFPKINGINSQKLAEMLYENYSISIMPGEVFNQKDYIRINMAQSIEDFRYLLRCIQTITEN